MTLSVVELNAAQGALLRADCARSATATISTDALRALLEEVEKSVERADVAYERGRTAGYEEGLDAREDDGNYDDGYSDGYDDAERELSEKVVPHD